MIRLLYEINAFEELFGSALVENVILYFGTKKVIFLEDEAGRTTSIFV